MLSTPIIREYSIIPFSADKPYTFNFEYYGSNQVVRNNLIIERVNDNVVVYNQITETFELKHVVPANILENQHEYRVRVRVSDINNNWSNFSSYIIFWVIAEPTITIINIDYANQNRVYNQTVLFQAEYYQPDGDLLQSYKYYMYDSNKKLIKVFEEQFSDGMDLLTQEIAGLTNGTHYYLEVKTTSVNGRLGSSGLVEFVPLYVTPRISVVLTPENIYEQGFIRLNAALIQVILKLYDNNGNEINPINVEYIDNEWIDLTRLDYDKLIARDGFSITKPNFVLKLWCKNVPDDIVFLTLRSNYGRVEFIKYENRIHAFKYLNGSTIKPHFASNELVIGEDEEFVLYVKSENNLLDLVVQKV